jgi:hypothetical protein
MLKKSQTPSHLHHVLCCHVDKEGQVHRASPAAHDSMQYCASLHCCAFVISAAPCIQLRHSCPAAASTALQQPVVPTQLPSTNPSTSMLKTTKKHPTPHLSHVLCGHVDEVEGQVQRDQRLKLSQAGGQPTRADQPSLRNGQLRQAALQEGGSSSSSRDGTERSTDVRNSSVMAVS